MSLLYKNICLGFCLCARALLHSRSAYTFRAHTVHLQTQSRLQAALDAAIAMMEGQVPEDDDAQIEDAEEHDEEDYEEDGEEDEEEE
jgi:hypothetical protein